jgi:hypothetical protein
MEFKNLKILRILTFLLAVSLTIVSVAGAFLPATYEHDAASMAAQGVGQDLVDLFLVVPLLLVSYYMLTRNNRVAALIYGGTLFYILYSFVIYCFGVHFNQLFLMYCATLGISMYTFILFMRDIQRMDVGSWFERAPVKLVSIYLLFVAAVFYALWLSSILPAIIGNTVPPEVADYGLLVNPVHVIDLAFALPGLIIGALLIRKKHTLGFLIASLALFFMIILTIALAAMVIMLFVREISEEFTVALVFSALALLSVIISVFMFRKTVDRALHPNSKNP